MRFRFGLALVLLAWSAVPASAHSLRVFATVEGSEVSGYAFFVGGGRPHGAAWTAAEGGSRIASGTTGEDGSFRFVPDHPATADVQITVDTGDGHVSTATIAASRLGGAVTPQPTDGPARQATDLPNAENSAIETAVERAIAPLLERIEAMDARMRLTDMISGVFLILGLAGMALWAKGRGR